MTLLTVARVATLAENWDTVAAAATRFSDRLQGNAESVVHEMCHAAAFRWNLLEPAWKRRLKAASKRADHHLLRSWVSRRFYESYQKPRRKLASDKTECEAIAVEFLVYKKLAWEFPYDTIITLAALDMFKLDAAAADDEVQARCSKRRTQTRADTVITWLGYYALKR